MWALRAAVRAGRGVSSLGRGRLTPGAPPPPRSARALAAASAAGHGGPGDRKGHGSRNWGRARGPGSLPGEDEEEPAEEEEEEEEELLRGEPLLPAGTRRVCLVHPDVKWGPGKPQLTTAQWQVAEATALVHTLDGWSVVQTMVMPTKTPDKKLIFGRGNLEHLSERIRASPEVTSVFLNVERLAVPTKRELEAAWGVEVLDRFALVLHIFRCNARTKEAKLQVALAEVPLLRSDLRHSSAPLGRQSGASRYILGSGASFAQVRHRLLKEKELKIRRALERLRGRRELLRGQRTRRELPVVAVVGYTNAGKTSLIRALTQDPAALPRDQLFATLDVTAHAGRLPSRLPVLYVDTVGFLSQLPHGLIQSFSATLEDVAHSDVLVHVRDISHPESERQKATVLSTLRGLRLPARLLDSMLEVHNKVDLAPGYSVPEPGALAVSARLGLGLRELEAALDAAVLGATGRRALTLHVPLAGPQLSWLHREATVQDVTVQPEAGAALVTVIISSAAYGKFRKLFPE